MWTGWGAGLNMAVVGVIGDYAVHSVQKKRLVIFCMSFHYTEHGQ